MEENENNEVKQEKVTKGVKIAIGAGIGYVIFRIILTCIGLVIAFCIISKIFGKFGFFGEDKVSPTDIINQTGNVINQVNNSKNEMDRKSFNSRFDIYSGDTFTQTVNRVLDNVIVNNKTNSEHIIEVVFGNTTTSNVDEILSIKESLGELERYNISLDYDENAYVHKVTITHIQE